MGLLKGCLKVVGTVALGAAGTVSKVLEEASDAVGFELGTELFSATKNASVDGIQNMWNNETVDNLREKVDTIDGATTGIGRQSMANTAKKAAEVARRNGDMEKYEYYMNKYEEYK